MKPFRKHVAIAIDGGGIRGIVVAQALAILEEALGASSHQLFRLTAGTSTGAILAAGIAAGMSGHEMLDLYLQLGESIFPRSWRTAFFPLARYRYSSEPFRRALELKMGGLKMGDFWSANPRTDVVITTFDLQTNHTRFVKPWKDEYRDWSVVKAVMASSTVPTYFPVVEGRYVDGGVGSFANPSYVAAYEVAFCLNWDPAETTLLSFGTGRVPHRFDTGQAEKLWPWQWLTPTFNAFLQSSDDQQVHLVDTFFRSLDFRRFQINLDETIEMDDVKAMDKLVTYGQKLGLMVLNDQTDEAQDVIAEKALSL